MKRLNLLLLAAPLVACGDTEPKNEAPNAVGTIPDQEIHPADEFTVDLGK